MSHSDIAPPPKIPTDSTVPIISDVVVLFAGITGGIGTELLNRLLMTGSWKGAKVGMVLCVDYFPNPEAVAKAKAAIVAKAEKMKIRVEVFHWDASNVDSTAEVTTKIDACSPVIDAMLLTTGMGFHGDLNKLSIHDSHKALVRLSAVNFIGPSLLATHCATRMVPNRVKGVKGAPVILMMSSYSGLIGLPHRAAYCASKFALNGFAESLYADMRHLRIVLVCPTSVDTGFRDAWKKELGSISTGIQDNGKAALTVGETIDACWTAFNNTWRPNGIQYVVMKGWRAETAAWAIRTWFLGDYARYRVLRSTSSL